MSCRVHSSRLGSMLGCRRQEVKRNRRVHGCALVEPDATTHGKADARLLQAVMSSPLTCMILSYL